MEILIIGVVLIVAITLFMLVTQYFILKALVDHIAISLIDINANTKKGLILGTAIKGYIAMSQGWETKASVLEEIDELDN